ncbi:unnamed protein product [marine sediment metagenome]|uniref:Uncharacterized protein n=1 Tax=marine sediment metagenome TaxID=412755 RepID=X1ADG9_9ZZZZ
MKKLPQTVNSCLECPFYIPTTGVMPLLIVWRCRFTEKTAETSKEIPADCPLEDFPEEE